MTATDLYLAAFLLGLVLSVLSFAGGLGHLHLGRLHLSHAAPTHKGPAAVNLLTLAAFLSWFGGIGYLLASHHRLTAIATLVVAIASGLAAGSLLSLFFTRVLLRHERPLLPADTEMRGIVAQVSMPLRAQGTGEILFSLNGTRRAAAARTETGQPVARGQEVLVLRYERGIAWVQPFDTL